MRWQRGMMEVVATMCLGTIVGLTGSGMKVKADDGGHEYSFRLEPVDEATGQPFYVPLGDDGKPYMGIGTENGIWASDHGTMADRKAMILPSGIEPTYRNALKAEGDTFGNRIDYVWVYKYLSLETNDSLSGGKLSEFDWEDLGVPEGNATQNHVNDLSGKFDELGSTFNQAIRYTLDLDKFEDNLDQTFNYEPTSDKVDVIQVPFKQSTAAIKLTVVTYPDKGDKTIQADYEMITGLKGKTVPFKADLADQYDLNQSSVTFNGSADQKETLVLIDKNRPRTATIHFVHTDGTQAAPDQKVTRENGQKQTVTSPTIAGETPDSKETFVDFSDAKFKEDPDQETTVTYTKPTVPATNTGTSPVQGSFVPFQVYAKQKIYRYQHIDFKKGERVQGYVKKPRIYAPVFKVVGTATSKAGNPRYKLSDGTYITAKESHIAKLFWQGKTFKKLYVVNPKGIWTHTKTTFDDQLKHLNQGTVISVVKQVKDKSMTRYQLSDGTYITGNKRYVTPNKPKTVTKVQAKGGRNLYSDVNLTRRLKHYKSGHVFVVEGWDYSHGKNPQIFGTKRYKVAGGYITGNQELVTLVE
ncbi:DUF5776 domain-containing protein [Levilactobacillus huananensis]|uniref:DUF5776 domain-containing protein n=1 Tax=Levilactobacillus huananensis TaxID=2486019 RepID=UPI000F7768D0|nr:DUF5776 domain-containing protein [Levilactobacillus huananensis]